MPNHDDIVTKYDWGIIAETPFGTVVRTNEELQKMEEEVNNLPELEFRKDEPTVTTLDLVDMCLNEDGSVDTGMVRSLQQMRNAWIKERKEVQARASVIETDVRKMKGLLPSERKRRIEGMMMLYVEFPVDQINEKIARVDRVLSLVGRKESGKDSDLNIEKAKLYPITELIEFDRAGFACCIWHNEKTPSMKYYKKNNKVHCFGCSKSGDAVDVYQVIRNCSFVDAVKALAG